MAYKRLRIGGLGLYFSANQSGLDFGVSFDGRWWDKFADVWTGRKRNQDSRAENSTHALTDSVKAEAAAADHPVNDIIWYHTFDFGDGVKTPGVFDHGPILHKYKLPVTLAGKRVLDVATFDGFWAMEFERRGADEVIALDLESSADLDWAPKLRARASTQELSFKFGQGFDYAKRQLNSKVKRVICNVYDLTPEKFGTFDIVHVGDVLLHLQCPVRALQNVASVCTDYAIISDVFVPELERHGPGAYIEYLGAAYDYTWWQYSLKALERMILDAGFSEIELITKFKYGGRDMPEKMNHAVFKARK